MGIDKCKQTVQAQFIKGWDHQKMFDKGDIERSI